MFCDLADSTKLAQELDPEDLREVIRAYQATAAAIIEQYGGHIAQYLGDGVLIYFGWPMAHEDDAQRALHTGLGLVEAMTTTLNPRLAQDKGVQLAVRIGIHTGPMVVGAMGGGTHMEQLATGDTVNIAARNRRSWIVADVGVRMARCECGKYFQAPIAGVPHRGRYSLDVRNTVDNALIRDRMPYGSVIRRMHEDDRLELSLGSIHAGFLWAHEQINMETHWIFVRANFSGVLCIDAVHDSGRTMLFATDPLGDFTYWNSLGIVKRIVRRCLIGVMKQKHYASIHEALNRRSGRRLQACKARSERR